MENGLVEAPVEGLGGGAVYLAGCAGMPPVHAALDVRGARDWCERRRIASGSVPTTVVLRADAASGWAPVEVARQAWDGAWTGEPAVLRAMVRDTQLGY